MAWTDTYSRVNASMLRTFGEAVNFHAAGGVGEPLEVTAVWNDGEGQMPQGVRAIAWLLESDLGGIKPAKNDIVRRGNFTYRVVDPPEGIATVRDGTGGITIYLKQASHAPDA